MTPLQKAMRTTPDALIGEIVALYAIADAFTQLAPDTLTEARKVAENMLRDMPTEGFEKPDILESCFNHTLNAVFGDGFERHWS